MPINVILGITLVCVVASVVNGVLGATFLLFFWVVLQGIIRQSQVQAVQITEWTWTPHLLVPVAIFLIIWQVRLRGRIGPQVGIRDLLRRRGSLA